MCRVFFSILSRREARNRSLARELFICLSPDRSGSTAFSYLSPLRRVYNLMHVGRVCTNVYRELGASAQESSGSLVLFFSSSLLFSPRFASVYLTPASFHINRKVLSYALALSRLAPALYIYITFLGRFFVGARLFFFFFWHFLLGFISPLDRCDIVLLRNVFWAFLLARGMYLGVSRHQVFFCGCISA